MLAFWLLFDQILGLISLRTDTGLTLVQAQALGAAINILPDYLSLYQTRWLLRQFQRVRTPLDTALWDWFPATVCQHLARMTQDDVEKLALLSKACEGGATEECFDTGFRLFKIQPEKAVRLWTKSCTAGEAAGYTNLSYMYDHARGVAQDYARAAELYQQGCRMGSSRSCDQLKDIDQ